MPTPTEILTGLSLIANRYWPIALAFHLAVAALCLAAWRGWRPPNLTVARLLLVPVLSVAGFAALAGNPFNAAVFLILAIALAVATRRITAAVATAGSAWSAVAGLVMVLFGLLYPHFLARGSVLAYLYAAPTGLLPCPTLSLVIGVTLLFGGLGSWAWSGPLVAAGLFYGVLGALRLGVLLDGFLVAGSLALAITMSLATPARRRQAAAPSTAG
jgi:hypothetical protein